MATNIILEPGYKQAVVVTSPATPASGDPVRFGKLTGLALLDEGDGNAGSTETVVDFGPMVADVLVDDNEGTGVAVGDAIYFHDTPTGSPTVQLNNSASGANGFFGTALEAITANGTERIKVFHFPVGLSSTVASEIGTGQIADNAVTAAKIADNVVSGSEVANVANVNTVGGIPVVFRTAIPSGANGDVDITIANKVRVIDAWAVLKGAGTTGSLLTLKSTSSAISNAIDVAAGNDKDVFHTGQIDDANHEIASGGKIRWSKASTGGDFPGAECYVLALRIA